MKGVYEMGLMSALEQGCCAVVDFAPCKMPRPLKTLMRKALGKSTAD